MGQPEAFELEQAEKEKEIYKLRNYELAKANKAIESKNKDITDSIKYAKHIQEASLPDKALMDKYLKDYFVLYRPKDIYGLFLLLAEKAGKIYVAVGIAQDMEFPVHLYLLLDKIYCVRL